MENNVILRRWEPGIGDIDNLCGTVFTGENQAHTFRIRGWDGTAQIAFTGTVTASFLNSKNTQVTLPGALENGEAVVTLTSACYQVPGRFVLSIYVADSERTVCVYSGTGVVTGATADSAYDAQPSTVAGHTVAYQAGASGTEAPTGEWSDTVPVVPQGQYLWTRLTIAWSSGGTTISYIPARQGLDGLGSVRSVNQVSPDANGNVALPTDSAPTAGSGNLMTSGGIYTALGGMSGLTIPLPIGLGGTGAANWAQAQANLLTYLPYLTSVNSGLTDLDSVTFGGLYQVAGNTDNAPNTSPQFVLSMTNNDGTRKAQVALRSTGAPGTEANNRIYMRKHVDGTWGDWSYLVNSMILPNVYSNADSISTLAALVTYIDGRATGDRLIVRVSGDVMGSLAGSSSYAGVAIVLKASASNAYYFAFSRGTAAFGNISITNGTVSVKNLVATQ